MVSNAISPERGVQASLVLILLTHLYTKDQNYDLNQFVQPIVCECNHLHIIKNASL